MIDFFRVFQYILNNSICATVVTIISLCIVILCKNKSSANWKYSLLKINLLFYIVPFTMISGEIIHSLDLINTDTLTVYSSKIIDLESYLNDDNQYKNNDFISNIYVDFNSDFNIENNYILLENINQETHLNKGFNMNFTINHLYIIWCLGIFIGILWLIYCYIRCVLDIKKSYNIENQLILNTVEEVKKELKISSEIKVVYNDRFTSPILFGLFNPTIILPLHQNENDFLRNIISHELIHYKRKDLHIKIILLFIQILNWFNPIVYLLGKNLDKYLEYSCDENVVKVMNKDQRKMYGLAIIEYVSSKGNNFITVALTPKKEELKGRIDNMLKYEIDKKTSKIITGVVGMMVATAVIVPAITYSNNKEILEVETGINKEEFQKLIVEYDSTFEPIFDKSNLSSKEYGQYIIESFYRINFNDINANKPEIAFQNNDNNEILLRENILTTSFNDENNTFLFSNINEETMEVYEINKSIKRDENSVDINEISQEFGEKLIGIAVMKLADIGIPIETRTVDFYKTGLYEESISVSFLDEFGNQEFIEFTYPDCEVIGYNYFEKNSQGLEDYLDTVSKFENIQLQGTVKIQPKIVENIGELFENNNVVSQEPMEVLATETPALISHFNPDNFSSEEYSKHIIESFLSVAFNNLDFNSVDKIVFQEGVVNEALMKENVFNTLFYADDYNTFVQCDINEETFQIYGVSKGISGELATINIDKIPEELATILLNKSNEFLNKVGLTMNSKEIEFYKSDDNDFARCISLVLTDDFGNKEFVSFVYPVEVGSNISNVVNMDYENYELLSYEYFDARSSIIQSYMNHQIKLN